MLTLMEAVKAEIRKEFQATKSVANDWQIVERLEEQYGQRLTYEDHWDLGDFCEELLESYYGKRTDE